MIETSWKLEQATFTVAEATEITGIDPNLRRQWRNRGYLPKMAAPFGKVMLREVVWLLALSRTPRMKSQAATYIGPAVDYALSYLALKNMPLPFVGIAEDRARFEKWCADKARARTWVHRELNIPSGDVHRYTVFHPREGTVQVDKLSEVDAKLPSLAKCVVSGSAIANRISAALTKPPFVASSVH